MRLGARALIQNGYSVTFGKTNKYIIFCNAKVLKEC